jgi:Phosphoesterase family
MLIVTYDEHGGFFDHVLPPAAHDDRPAFRTYRVPVPALVVSPFTERRSVLNVTYDHTSIIRRSSCASARGTGRSRTWGARREREPPRRDAEAGPAAAADADRGVRDAVDRITAWRADVFRSRVLMEPLTLPPTRRT